MYVMRDALCVKGLHKEQARMGGDAATPQKTGINGISQIKMFRSSRRLVRIRPSVRPYATLPQNQFRDGRSLVGVAVGLFAVNLLLRRRKSDDDELVKEAMEATHHHGLHDSNVSGDNHSEIHSDGHIGKVEAAREKLKQSTFTLEKATATLASAKETVKETVRETVNSATIHADAAHDATLRVEAARQRLLASTAKLNHENERVLLEKKTVMVEVSPEEAALLSHKGTDRQDLEARLALAETKAKQDYARRLQSEKVDAVKVSAERQVHETEAELRKRAAEQKAKNDKRIAVAEAARQAQLEKSDKELAKFEAPIDSFHGKTQVIPSAEQERAALAKRVAAAEAARQKMADAEEKAKESVKETVKELVKEVKHEVKEAGHSVKAAVGSVMGALGLSADQEKTLVAKRIAAAEAARQKLVDAEEGAQAVVEDIVEDVVEDVEEAVEQVKTTVKKVQSKIPFTGNLRKDMEARIAAERANLRKEARVAPPVAVYHAVEQVKEVVKEKEVLPEPEKIDFHRPEMSVDEERSFLEKRVQAAEAARQRLLDGASDAEVAPLMEKKSRVGKDIPYSGNLRKDLEARLEWDRVRLQELQRQAKVAALEIKHAKTEAKPVKKSEPVKESTVAKVESSVKETVAKVESSVKETVAKVESSVKDTVAKAETAVKDTVTKAETAAMDTVHKVEHKAVETAGKAMSLLHAAEAKAMEYAHEAKEKLVHLEHKVESMIHHTPADKHEVAKEVKESVKAVKSAVESAAPEAEKKLAELQKKAEDLLHRAEAAVKKVEKSEAGGQVGELVKRAEEAVQRAHDAARRADESRKAILEAEAGIYTVEKRLITAQDKVKEVTARAEDILRKRVEEDEQKRALIGKKLAEEAKKRYIFTIERLI
jgi:hypothetical protein